MVALSPTLLAGATAKASVEAHWANTLGWSGCSSRVYSGKLANARPNLAVFKKLAPGVVGIGVPQKRWSRGCLRSDASFWFWQWQLPSPHVPRKKKSLSNRSRSSLWTPASTSRLSGRASRQQSAWPAPNLPNSARFEDGPAISLKNVVISRCPVWAGILLSAIGSVCHFDRRISGC